jgi:hypothetical protein
MAPLDGWIEIQDVDAPEVRYVFIGRLLREDG